MGRKMWWPGVSLPVFLLLVSASVNSGPVINGDGLLFREPESDLWSAPARALKDYRYLRQLAGPSPPDLGELAPSYHCPESGFFAKDGSCKNYYKCEETSEPGILTAHLFTCQPGMVFDDNLDTCDLASQVTTRPECKTEGTIPDIVSKDEAHSIDLRVLTDNSWQMNKFQCTGETVKQMAEGTDKICMNVNYVDDYVNLVMSMIPLREYHKNNEKMADILENYDRDLEAAQDHAEVWREGDSILIGIGQTVKLAKDFEPEFTRKYERNKERVKTIEKNLHEEKLVKNTREAITKLEKRLVDLTKTMNNLPEEFRAGLQPTISDIERDLVEKRRELKEDFTLTREIEELIVFLEFVRNDASKIQTVAYETRTRIDAFKSNLDKDKTAFLRHFNVSKLTLEKHNTETIRKNKKLAKIEADRLRQESEIKEENQIIKKLLSDITNSYEQIYHMRREIMTRGQPVKRFFELSLLIPMIPSIIGLFIDLATSGEKEELMNLEKDAELNAKKVESIKLDIQNRNDEIARLQAQINEGSGYSKSIQSELDDYTIINHDLTTMNSQLDQLIPAIDKAIHGIDGIKCVFDSVIGKLDTMITHAKEAKTDYEKTNARFYTYNEISVLQDNWKGVYDLLLNLDVCTGLLI